MVFKNINQRFLYSHKNDCKKHTYTLYSHLYLSAETLTWYMFITYSQESKQYFLKRESSKQQRTSAITAALINDCWLIDKENYTLFITAH